ncbi:Uncharacterized protein OS=Lysobacter capsici AZ78 GN=AZ78_10485 PE=4 SV=1 [Gemmata massiliana]|uniref:Uncharacterized protein n=1 Tax=Gemmata massiliana TaxID=1210884 RepID=A0A6P2CZI9_9BACT|nr:hypothetical protein [Gemmata massiliana]VTR93977.1 Uncharacterized protein OS=Lysobacter capsici AZ78 GN=AZ78_10485 PE=4 SV=1 [Gemmata massiliana]
MSDDVPIPPKLRMYILVRESVPVGFAVLAAAHASLAAYLQFVDTPEVKEWLAGPFYKAVCRVSDAEFEKAKEAPEHVVVTESALDGQEVAIAFKPEPSTRRRFGSSNSISDSWQVGVEISSERPSRLCRERR